MEMVMDNVQQLRTVISRIRGDSSHSTNPLTMKLNGTLDAAVNGGVSKFEVSGASKERGLKKRWIIFFPSPNESSKINSTIQS